MPPNLRRKLHFYAAAARRLLAIAKARNVSFLALFFGDANSVFGEREDHDKHEIFVRLAKVRALAPYLADTVLFSPPFFSPTADLPSGIIFPLVMKPIRGVRSVGIVGVRDEKTLRRYLRNRRRRYIAQHFMRDAREIGVSYTRNPTGSPDFFGVAAKEPVRWTEEWRDGLCRIPKYFHCQDWTRNVDRERFLELCRTIAVTLRTNSFRFDAFVLKEDGNLKMDTMRIIDVNTGVFAVDEFLFDTGHSTEFVIEELTRKYTYLLLWGVRHTPHLAPSKMRRLVLHYLYCLALYCHFSETSLMSKLRDAVASFFDILGARKARHHRRQNIPADAISALQQRDRAGAERFLGDPAKPAAET